ERKIKRYYLWVNEVDGTDLIFREGNSWYVWAAPDTKIKNYAEYTIESDAEGIGGRVIIISTNTARTETIYDITGNYITLLNNAYINIAYDINQDDADALATDVSLPDYKDAQFKASSILVQHCGSLYKIKDFTANPYSKIELFKTKIKVNRAGEDNIEYARSVIVGRRTLLRPKDSIELIWKIKAPSNEETSGLTQPCRFKFNVKYSAVAKSEAHIYFANPLEIMQQSITDKDMSMRGTIVRTFGPMAIDLASTTKQPVMSSNKWTIKLIVSNKGVGYGHINSLSLDVNKNSNDIFGNIKTNIDDDEAEYYCDFINIDDTLEITDVLDYSEESKNKILLNKLNIYKGKTSEIRCTMDSPEVNIMEPYMFTTVANYDYILQGYINVKTKPDKEI
ncbi:MAG: hypothetical protein KAQ92_05625, partial [Candidatus Aenigmarchaeota archaeon]|nr:hypothetical protein [Candidatus Aenigmarchaeota archaeon]